MKTNKQLFIIFLISLTFVFKGQNSIIGPFAISSIDDPDGVLYLIPTVFFSTINTTTTYFNIKKLHKYDKYRSNAIFGAISGVLQTGFGLINIHTVYNTAPDYIPTGINIGLGLTTITTSIIRLATKNPPKENKVAFNFYYIPSGNKNNSILGIHIVKPF